MKRNGATITATLAALAALSVGTLTITGSGTKAIRSYTDSDFKLSLSTSTVSRVIASGGNNFTTNSGRTYTNYTSATVVSDQQFSAACSGSMAVGPQGFTITSSNTNAGTINSAGYLTYVTNGTTTVTFAHNSIPPYSVSYPVTEAYQTGVSSQPIYVGWQPGLMPYDMVNEVDSLATNATPGTTLNRFTSYVDNAANGTISATRNTAAWTGAADWSGVAFASSQSDSPNHAGALITPQDMITANHWQYGNGATVYFLDNSNGVHTATVSSQANVSGTDIQVVHLSTALTGVGLKYYRILPVNSSGIVNYCPDYNLNNWPIVIAYNFGHVFYTLDTQATSVGPTPGGYTNELQYQASTESNRKPYTATISSGSGSPGFAIINGEPILVGCLHTTVSFSWLAPYTSAINTALSSLGSSYTVTTWTNSFSATSTNGSVTSFPTY